MNGSYCAVLEGHGIPYSLQGPWGVVDRGFPVQAGWKLHLSAIPIHAAGLLAAVVPYLSAQAISFKFARNELVLEYLNGGRLGATQVGKFVTIYPHPQQVRSVAEAIRSLTTGFQGPRVPSDLHLGGVLHARFGPFAALLRRDRLGLQHLQMRMPDGSLVDDAYRIPHEAPPGVGMPFEGLVVRSPQGNSGLFGPGYRILSVLREGAKGSTFLAIDLRTQDQVTLHVLKQGRRHCMSDRYGRDIDWRLRRELAHHRRLAGIPGLVRECGCFEVDGDLYLALEYIDGEAIDIVVDAVLLRRPWASVSAADRAALLGHLRALITIVAAMHARGVVHRDISASNIIVGATGAVYLLDLEMAHAIDDIGPVVGLGTPGFASPSQRRGDRPNFADDVFSLGCIATLVLTGLDPRRLLYAAESDRPAQLRALTGNAAELEGLLPMLSHALSVDRTARPGLAELAGAVIAAVAILQELPPMRPAGHPGAADPRTLLDLGLLGLLRSPRDAEGRWLSLPIGREEDEVAAEDLRPLRSAGRGAAGILYLLARATRAGHATPALSHAAAHNAAWLVEDMTASDAGLPGLYAGEDGVAVALTEAVSVGLLAAERLPLNWIRARLSTAIDWPDVVHGAAGQGIAALLCAPELAHRCAAYLIDTQEPDGAWCMPQGFPGLSGRRLTGFAHGVAGIVCFLAEYATREGNLAAERAWRAGTAWLIARAVSGIDDVLRWPYSDMQETQWRWWCHGGPGIALCLLRLAELSGEAEYRAFALRALAIHPPELRHSNLSHCHGISGIGEIYLEAFRVTGDEQWHDRALDIAHTIGALGRRDNGCITWLAGNANVSTAELTLGSAGILHFLLRLVEGPHVSSFPLLLPPSESRSRP